MVDSRVTFCFEAFGIPVPGALVGPVKARSSKAFVAPAAPNHAKLGITMAVTFQHTLPA